MTLDPKSSALPVSYSMEQLIGVEPMTSRVTRARYHCATVAGLFHTAPIRTRAIGGCVS